MDRAFASGTAGTPPAAPDSPSIGYPTAGNPSSGVPATKPGAHWYYMITEEIREVIVAAGITPAFNSLIQLRDALYAMFGRLASANVWASGNYCAEKPLPATTGNVALDLATGVNFGGQLTGNVTLVNPSNMQAGQSGIIRIQNDAATPRTISYGSYWKSPSGSMPALTGAAGAVDVFGYYVESASRITLVQQADVK